VTSRSSKLLHIDPLAIALEKRKQAEGQSAARENEKEIIRESIMDTQPMVGSQPIVSSQPTEQPRGGPVSNQPIVSSQPIASSQPRSNNQFSNAFDLLSSLPDVKGDTRLPHRILDHLFRLLKPDEQAVYLQLYRLSWGWNQDTCFISNPRLVERSNVPLSSMKRAVGGLVNKGLIEKTGHTNGFGKEQGVEYRVFKLSNQPSTGSQPTMSRQPNMDTNKVNTQKENTQTQEPSVTAMRVGSKFTIEECRKYAQHLQVTGQGINNPGGYATMIHRTGEADLLIAAFLHPEASLSSSALDISQCRDCNGTGFYYPKGSEGGVAKCKHTSLQKVIEP